MAELEGGYGPTDVRRLRGTQSRAAFARALGVTPQTVYRWELPNDAGEARRPRGVHLTRLAQFRRQMAMPLTAAGTPRELLDGKLPPLPPFTDGLLEDIDDVDEDTLRVLPALERILRGDHRRGHTELLQLVTSEPNLSANARGTAYFGISLWELCERSDARAALLLIQPLLNDAEAGRLRRDVSAKLFAIAALCHAMPDAMLFDLGRVQAYHARIDRSHAAGDHEAACITDIAVLCAATLIGDLELIERLSIRVDELRRNALPPLLELHIEEFSIFRGMLNGRFSLTIAQCEAIAARADKCGYKLVQARALARLALCQLDGLVDPEQVLLTTQRARALTDGGRVASGVHQPLILRAEIEALFRLGRTREALAVSQELNAWTAETGMPALQAVTAQMRVLSSTGREEELPALAANLRSCQLPDLRGICQAHADLLDAVYSHTRGEEPARAIALLERAETNAARWPFLVRNILLYRIFAHAAAGQEEPARVALRAAQRHADVFPSPWFVACLRRMEGALLAGVGLWNEGRQLLQTAHATFELAKDKSDALMTRYLMCLIAQAVERREPEELAGVREEIKALGLRESRGALAAVERFSAQLERRESDKPAQLSPTSERLVVPLQRVAMRGASPNLILSELATVAAELLPGRTVQLAEIDASGKVHTLSGHEQRVLSERDWVEFSDGAGRSLRLGVSGPLVRDERATLSLLTIVAAQALELATLRSVDERALPAAGEQPLPELPGFVAASSEMRTLRSELKRLAASRSTVIITGESGTGKDVVAHAIHALSERSAKPYIAFNCATVPRELFEGQLFGYRRGSFTGATSDHSGVIRAANGGTLFLDEIGELPLDIQPKLLRFLENSEVFPLGERAPVRVDVRVLAATHRDLTALIRAGTFREDLYYRLQVVPVFIPPLREHRDDIAVLARHFLRELTRRGEPPVLAPDALSALVAQPLPGNVRELKNIIERALAYFPDQPVLRAEHLRLPRARSIPSPPRY